jgi:hypothetical protein
MKFGWPTQKEIIARGAAISPEKKLEAIRLMNELADKVLTTRQKAMRRELRESR